MNYVCLDFLLNYGILVSSDSFWKVKTITQQFDFNVARVYIFLLVNYFTRFGKQKNMSKKSLCIPF